MTSAFKTQIVAILCKHPRSYDADTPAVYRINQFIVMDVISMFRKKYTLQFSRAAWVYLIDEWTEVNKDKNI